MKKNKTYSLVRHAGFNKTCPLFAIDIMPISCFLVRGPAEIFKHQSLTFYLTFMRLYVSISIVREENQNTTLERFISGKPNLQIVRENETAQ